MHRLLSHGVAIKTKTLRAEFATVADYACVAFRGRDSKTRSLMQFDQIIAELLFNP